MSARRALRRFAACRSGSATIEFVILFPAFITLMAYGIESGILMTRQAMLERGTDIAMRELRLNINALTTPDRIKRRICDEAVLLPDCRENLFLELRPVSFLLWDLPVHGPTCIDRTAAIRPLDRFVPGGEDELMIVRACYVVDPMIPGTGLAPHLPLDASGGYQLVATSSFVNEPSK